MNSYWSLLSAMTLVALTLAPLSLAHEPIDPAHPMDHIALSSIPGLAVKPAAANGPSGIASIDKPGLLLPFSRFFQPGPRALLATPELVGLGGKQVQVTGFMVRMEIPPTGNFFLTPYPLETFEDGGGSGDLPSTAVRVLVTGAKGKVIDPVSVRISLTGRLYLGHAKEIDALSPEGQITYLNLILDNGTPINSSVTQAKENARNVPHSPASQTPRADLRRTDPRRSLRAAHR